MSLILKNVNTFDLKIKIECPAASGFFIGKARIKSKPETKELFDKVDSGEVSDDMELIQELFEGFDGLPCEAGQEFKYMLEGPLSSYLVPAAIQAYFEHYGEARVGNSQRRRK